MGIHGNYFTEKQISLDRLNEIRLEACNEGVKDPETKKKLTKGDYKPLKWSTDLEKIARIRAMESILTMGHIRLNNKDIWSVKFNSQQSWGENLAWNNSSNSVGMINQWYDEKKDWVTGGPGVTGHYESIISTRYKYVGLGWFAGTSGKYAYCLAGEFSDYDNLTEGFLDEEIDIIQKIDVSKKLIKKYYLECPDTFYIGREDQIIPRVDITASQICPLWILPDEQKNLTYSTNNKNIIQLDPKSGKIKAIKEGKATITCLKKTTYAKKDISVVTEAELRKKRISLDLYWRNDESSDKQYWSYVPSNNPIGSNIICWIHNKVKNIVIEASDNTLLEVPKSIGEFVSLKVLGTGNVTLSFYTKDNPFCKITKEVNLG